MGTDIEKELKIIRQYNMNGNFDMSHKLLSKLLLDKKYKNNIGVILEMGQLLSGQGKFNSASDYFESLLKIEDSNIHAFLGLCRCFIFLNKPIKLRKIINSIMINLNNKDKKTEREKCITLIIKEIFDAKIKNKIFADNKKEVWLKIIKDNIIGLEKKEKINMSRYISLYYRQRNELNQEEKFLKNIIFLDSFDPEINKMYIESLITQQKYKEAYQYTNLLKLNKKRSLLEYTVNNLIRVNVDNLDGFDELSIDSMLTYYFKLARIQYLKNDSNFTKKLNSLLFKILVSVRQQNYKIEDQVYIQMLQQIGKKYFNIKNAIVNEMEWNRKKIILKSKPRVAQIMLTNSCNSQCKMCDISKKNKWQLNNIGFKNISKILKYIDSVTWQGGEVQFYNRFAELVSLARKYNVSQHVITNGINWDEDLLKEIMQGDMNIAISVDGFDCDTYKYIRGIDGFNKLKDFISIFNKYRTNQNKLKLYTTVMNANVEQLQSISEFAIKNKIDEVVLSPLKKLVDNDFFYKENIFFPIDGTEFIEYNDKIKTVNMAVENLSKELSIAKIKFVSYLPKIEENNPVDNLCASTLPKIEENNPVDNLYASTLPKIEENNPVNNVRDSTSVFLKFDSEIEDNFCQAPWKHIAITENGAILPSFSCGSHLILGNVNYCDIFTIWNSKQMQNIRKDLISIVKSDKLCGKCKSVGC